MFQYLDVMKKLRAAGYSRKKLREENLLAQSTIENIRHGKNISMDSLDMICNLLDRPIEEIVKHVKEERSDEKCETATEPDTTTK